MWFDPPSNPGSTVIMHQQPGDIWLIDYQLDPTEDAEVETGEEEAYRLDVDPRELSSRPEDPPPVLRETGREVLADQRADQHGVERSDKSAGFVRQVGRCPAPSTRDDLPHAFLVQ